jgi:hypothetical protein
VKISLLTDAPLALDFARPIILLLRTSRRAGQKRALEKRLDFNQRVYYSVLSSMEKILI